MTVPGRGGRVWAAAALLGCTVDAVPISPRVLSPLPSLGGATRVAVSVIDDRLAPDARPWTEWISRSSGTAEIQGSAGSAAAALRMTLEEALRHGEFEIAESEADARAKLVVEIVRLRRQRLALSIRVTAELRATASRGSLKTVGLYRGEAWRTLAPVDHAQPVNDALSRALQSLLDDRALLETLRRP